MSSSESAIGRSMPAQWMRRCYETLLTYRTHPLDDAALGRPAMVFAPHQDDETLGCGATIMRKRQAGAAVQVVFMADGSSSHSHIISGSQLRMIRSLEAVAACEALGVPREAVHFLDFKEGRLAQFEEAAAGRVVALLEEAPPEQIFVPYATDPHEDHIATTRVVREAVRRSGLQVEVYEYPIWLWVHWPWAMRPLRRGALRLPHRLWTTLRDSVGTGPRLLRDFQVRVPIGELLERKEAALAQHKSQVTRLTQPHRWRVLGDVSGGEFLACFFREYELFHHYSLPPHA